MVAIRSNVCTREKTLCGYFYNGLPLQRHKSEQRNQKQIAVIVSKSSQYSDKQTWFFQQLAK